MWWRQLHRFNSVDDIPLGHFLRRKKLRVRLIRQSKEDPSVFYVYHTPFVRRVLLKDTLPSDALALVEREKTLLAVRPFGVQVDESAEEWIWANFVSSHQDMTIQLLQRYVGVLATRSVVTNIVDVMASVLCVHGRLAMPEGAQSIATCGMTLHKVRMTMISIVWTLSGEELDDGDVSMCVMAASAWSRLWGGAGRARVR